MGTVTIGHKNGEQMKRADRNSNIEILRIICMVFLIAHHCIVHGGAFGMENCVNKWIGLPFVPIGKICFDAFVAISAWYTVDSKFKASRFVRIWLQILFYNLLFTGMTALLGNGYAQPITWRTWLGAFFPVIGNSHGFAASYVIYYLCTPFLHYVADRLTKRRAALLVGILFLTQVFSTIMGAVTFYTQPMTSEILLFVLFYFTAFYLKRWPIKLETNMAALGLIVLFIWLGATGIWFGNAVHPDNRFFAVTAGLSGNELSLNNIIAGFALFLFFKNLRMPRMPRLNLVASTTFGILLFHDHNYFRPVVWGRIIRSGAWLNASPVRFAAYIALSVVVIFVLGALIDFVRQKFVEAPLMRSDIAAKACGWLDGVIQQRLTHETNRSEPNSDQADQGAEGDAAGQIQEESLNEKPADTIPAAAGGSRYYQRRFSIAVLACVAVYWLVCIIARSECINSYFVFDHHDTGMDYFNMLANLSHGDPWYASANYPAMCFLILRVFFRMLPQDLYVNGTDGFALRENMIAQLGYIFLVMICLVVIWELSQHFLRGKKADKVVFAASLLFSGPMMFLVERGNLLLLSLVSLLGYLALYDSPKKSLRYAGYLCLAFSAAIKIYPAFFGLLVPLKKRWKETVHLIAIGAVSFLIPFFFFDGFHSLLAMVRGFGAAADATLGLGVGYNFSFRGLLTLIAAILGHYKESWPTWVLLVPLAIGIWIVIIGDQEWKKLLGITLLCIWLPDFSYTYTLVLFLLPLLSFFCHEQKICRFNSVYAVLFVLLMIPYAVPMLPNIDAITGMTNFPASWSTIIINYAIFFFALLILLEHYLYRNNAEENVQIPTIKSGRNGLGRNALIAIILIIGAVVFPHILFGNSYFLMNSASGSDLLRANLPTYYQFYDSVTSGGSFWSWRMGIGTSMFTHADVYFDPFTYILFLAGRERIPDMFIWMFLAKIVCQGLSMYGYLRHFKLGQCASVAASVMYAFCGYSMIMGANFALGTILVYFPLALWAAEKWLVGEKPWLLLGAFFLIALYSYYFFYQAGIIVCIYIVVRAIQMKKSVIKYTVLLAGLGIVSILLAAPALLPQLELTLGTTRVSGVSDVDLVSLWKPQFAALATACIRMAGNDWLGNTVSDVYRGYQGDYFQYSCYTSMLFYVFLWYYIRTVRKERKRTLAIMAIIAAAVLFPVVGYMFNGFSTINARWMFMVSILECLLMAKSIDGMVSGEGVRLNVLLEGMAATFFIELLGMAVLSVGSQDFLSAFQQYVIQAKMPFLVLTGLFSAFFILCFIYNYNKARNSPRIRRVRWIVLIGLAFLMIGDIRFNYIRWFTPDTEKYFGKNEPIYYDASQDIIHAISGADPTFYRMYKNFDSVYDNVGIPSENDAMAQGYFGLKSYNSVNNPEYIKFLQTTGIYVCIPLDVESYRTAGVAPGDVTGQTLNYIDGVENDFLLMDYLGVKYYLAQNGTANVDENYTHLYSEQGIDVYQNSNAYPLAFINRSVMPFKQFELLSDEEKRLALMSYTIVDGVQGDAVDFIGLTAEQLKGEAANRTAAFELRSFSNDEVAFCISVEKDDSYLSMSVPYDDNWHIFIDGKETASERINISLLGAKIDQGTHEVVIRYVPKMFHIGLGLSAATLALIFLGICRSKYRMSNKESPKEPSSLQHISHAEIDSRSMDEATQDSLQS